MFNNIENYNPNKENSQIERVVSTTLSKLKTMVDSKTIIGDAKVTDSGATIIPISKVTLGYIGGGGEYGEQAVYSSKKEDTQLPFAGGSGAVLSMTPIGFLVGKDEEMKLVKLDSESNAEKLVDIAIDFMNKRVKGNDKSQ